jgi:hypothetical protein
MAPAPLGTLITRVFSQALGEYVGPVGLDRGSDNSIWSSSISSSGLLTSQKYFTWTSEGYGPDDIVDLLVSLAAGAEQ